jgi:hypothetical protein
MDACTITESDHGFEITGNGNPNYLMFDGFTLTSSPTQQTYRSGFEIVSASGGNVFCCHHLWFLNNVVSNYGQAGFQGAQSDFVYVIHNTFTNNAAAPSCDNGAQGSGISMVWPIAVSGYTFTADDQSNPVVGSLAAPGGGYFQQVYEWNVVANNHLTPCGNGDTDGNGIVADTWAGDNNCNGTTSSGEPPVYAHQGIIAFNVTYNNGGKGIGIFANDLGGGVHTFGVGITVANNSSYNNNLDTNNTGGDRAEINETCGGGNTFINNIAYAIRTNSGVTDNNNDYVGDSSGGAPSTFSNNVGFCVGFSGACFGVFHGAVWTSGEDPANPSWVNVGNTSAGTESTPPVGVNFALQSGSPAIGFGQTQSYLSPQSIDAGACYHTLTSCP